MLGAGWKRKRKLVPGPECDTPTKRGKGRAPPQQFFLCSCGELKPWEEMPPLPTADGVAPRFTRSPPASPPHPHPPTPVPVPPVMVQNCVLKVPSDSERQTHFPSWHHPGTTGHPFLLKITITNIYGAPVVKCWASGQAAYKQTLPSSLLSGSHYSCSFQLRTGLREVR